MVADSSPGTNGAEARRYPVSYGRNPSAVDVTGHGWCPASASAVPDRLSLRLTFVWLAAAVACLLPFPVEAQQGVKMCRVGVLWHAESSGRNNVPDRVSSLTGREYRESSAYNGGYIL